MIEYESCLIKAYPDVTDTHEEKNECWSCGGTVKNNKCDYCGREK